MTMMTRILMSGAGFAAFAAAAPATAQYAYPYGNNNYGTNMAAERCAAAVQNRLSYRGSSTGGILGALLGANRSYSNARVLSITQVNPNRNSVRVRGIASSGRVAYNPYGVGAYGMLGSNYAADLSFRCTVDYRGYVRDVDINRR
jgi:hypothetical protein